MSKLGSDLYVHYKWHNYKMYGISHSDEREVGKDRNNQLVAAYRAARDGLLAQINQNINNQDTEALEKRLNFFFPKNINASEGQVDFSKYGQIIIEEIQKKYPGFMNRKITANSNLAATYNSGGLDEVVAKPLEKFNSIFVSKNQQSVRLSTITARMNALDEVRKNLQSSKSNKLAQFTTDLDQLMTTYNDICENLALNKKKTIRLDQNNNIDFVNALQDMFLKYKIHNYSYFTGVLGEEFARASAELSAQLGAKVSQLTLNQFRQLTKGVLQSNMGQSASLLGTNTVVRTINPNNILLSHAKVAANTSVTPRGVQGKVDVSLVAPSGQTLFASIKNYSIKSDTTHLTLHSGSNLLYPLQDYPAYIAHFLNLVVPHDGQKSVSNNKQALVNSYKKLLVIYGFIGSKNDIGGNIPDYFIVNNNSATNGYKIYLMSDLLNQQQLKDKVNEIRIPALDSLSLDNTWIGSKNLPSFATATARVLKIISQMEAQKLEISITPKFLI